MRKSKGILILLFSLWIYSLFAGVIFENRIVWQCYSFDQTKKNFVAYNNSEWSSLRDAMKACKKESEEPKTCSVSSENCDALLNGQSVRPWWQCKAMDSLGYIWIGGYFRVADTAILQAKDQCYSFSAVPMTCYTNFFTCKKLNPY